MRQLLLESMATKLLIKEGILFLFYICIVLNYIVFFLIVGSHLFVVEWKWLDIFWLDTEKESQVRSC